MSATGLAGTLSVMSWPEICQQYPNEWVMLLDVEDEPNGMLRSGRLFAHDPSAGVLLDDPRKLPPHATLVHTWERELGLPFRRVEVLGEPIEHAIVDIVFEEE